MVIGASEEEDKSRLARLQAIRRRENVLFKGLLELFDEIVHHTTAEIFSSQKSVSSYRFHLQLAAFHFQNRYVESPSAQVENEHVFHGFVLIENKNICIIILGTIV